ncbi:MAG TPA: UDP binding domain-containing protein, partial [Bdellovibrionota bacterium]|nr:UDP binding domain-containing protein [Bdellovibrionota bacterium]
FETRFIALAGEINRKMPEFVREKAWRSLNRLGVAPSRSKVLALGVSYKADLNDFRESPAIEVIKLLQADGAEVVYHDPHVPAFREHGVAMESLPLTESLIKGCDLVLVLTAHKGVDHEWVTQHAKHVLDTRYATRKFWEKYPGKVTLL